MDLKLCLQLFLLLAFITPHMISGRDLNDIHEASRFSFPQHLKGSRKGHNIEGINTIKAYLQHYGYIPNNNNVKTTNNNNNNNNVFDSTLELAVKTYQEFFKLNVSGILDTKTLELMSTPRCGVPDVFYNGTAGDGGIGTFFKFFKGKPKWSNYKYSSLAYAYINHYPEYFKKPVDAAIQAWVAYSKFKIRLIEKDDHKSYKDIKISFEIGDHGDGAPFKYGVLAHAFRPQDGRLHFNGRVRWYDGANKHGYDIYSVALHEFGHILGLDHSQNHYAIMWPYMNRNQIKYLDNDDVDGLWALYDGWSDEI